MDVSKQSFPLAASLLCVFIEFNSYLQFVIMFASSFVKWSKYTYKLICRFFKKKIIRCKHKSRSSCDKESLTLLYTSFVMLYEALKTLELITVVQQDRETT